MILAIDIGNSFTHAGIYDEFKLKKKIIFPTLSVAEKHELPKKIINLSQKPIKKIGISSVVPQVNFYWKNLIKKYFNINSLFITNKIKLPIKIKLNKGKTVGSDRICNAVAGYEYFNRKQNVIIIDLGTATTYDIVLKTGEFAGGIIAPGIKTAADSLHDKTAKLPLIPKNKLIFPQSASGKDTIEAMQSGIMYAALDSMEGMISRLEKIYGVRFRIILTGGFAPLINVKTSHKSVIREDLVMDGINYIIRFSDAE